MVRTRKLATAVAVLGVVSLTASPAVASSQLAGTWDFDEGRIGAVVAPGTAFGSPALYAAADHTTLSTVSVPRGRALDVTAWRNLRAKDKVDRTESMLSTDPRFASGAPWGTDDGSSNFDPGSGDFRVSVWIRPTDADDYPRRTSSPQGISPNLAQKGLSTASGGFWKLDLHMVATGSGYAWAPGCVFKSRDGKSAVANTGKKAFVLKPGVGAEITCERRGNLLTLAATGDDGSVRVSSVRVPTGMTIDNSAAVSVAQKPGSTDAGDAYDGLLTDLTIERG